MRPPCGRRYHRPGRRARRAASAVVGDGGSTLCAAAGVAAACVGRAGRGPGVAVGDVVTDGVGGDRVQAGGSPCPCLGRGAVGGRDGGGVAGDGVGIDASGHCPWGFGEVVSTGGCGAAVVVVGDDEVEVGAAGLQA